MTRHGDWIQTYTGRQFWPLDPQPEDICIEDIAHALSMQCRFSGHVQRFYSVAEHSVVVSAYSPNDDALWGLLHDASEAYLVDVPRPLKPHLTGYKEAELRVMCAVAERFSLPWPEPPSVKEIDNRILFDERAQLMAEPPAAWNFDAEPLGWRLECQTPERAERCFLKMFDMVGGVR